MKNIIFCLAALLPTGAVWANACDDAIRAPIAALDALNVGSDFVGHLRNAPEKACYVSVTSQVADMCGRRSIEYTVNIKSDSSKPIYVGLLYKDEIRASANSINISDNTSLVERSDSGYSVAQIPLNKNGSPREVRAKFSNGWFPNIWWIKAPWNGPRKPTPDSNMDCVIE